MEKKLMYEELRNILSKYEKNTKTSAEEIISELKRGAKTYKELERALIILRKTILFEYPNRDKYMHLLDEVKRLIDEEKNDLPLTNRSE